MSDNLVKRCGVYSARLYIPVEFQSVVGRREVVRSLKTADKRQALVMLRRLQSCSERLFFMVRAGMIHREQLTAILLNYIDNELSSLREADNDPRLHPDDTLYETSARKYLSKEDCSGGLSLSEQYRKLAEGVRKDFFVKRDTKFVGEFAELLLQENGVELDKESSDFSKFNVDFAHIYIMAMKEIANRIEGIKKFDYREAVKMHIEESRPITLKEAADEWLDSKKASGKIKESKNSTLTQYVGLLRRILNYFGNTYPIKKLNNVELKKYVTHLTGSDVKNVTIKKCVKMIQNVAEFANINHGTPLHKYKIELKDDSIDVPPLTVIELNKLFEIINDRRKVKPWQFWSTLIALTTGLRAGEVVNLMVTDIKKTSDDIYFLTVRESKTKAGIRDVPLPDVLLNLGFINFLNDRTRSRHPYLFMDYVKRSLIQVDRPKLSNWFQHLKKRHKFIEEGSNGRFHSMRHNFANALKQGEVILEMREDLCGHESTGRSAQKHYTEVYDIGLKQLAINQARWECDFSLLKAT